MLACDIAQAIDKCNGVCDGCHIEENIELVEVEEYERRIAELEQDMAEAEMRIAELESKEVELWKQIKEQLELIIYYEALLGIEEEWVEDKAR